MYVLYALCVAGLITVPLFEKALQYGENVNHSIRARRADGVYVRANELRGSAKLNGSLVVARESR
jgi:hypothetical protein